MALPTSILPIVPKISGPENLIGPRQPQEEEPDGRAACEASGGRWDADKNVCIPKTQITQEEFENRDKGKPQDIGTFSSSETGKLSGFQVGEQTFLGVAPQEVIEAVTREAEARELPIGGQAEGVIERQRGRLQTEGIGLAGQLGQSPDEAILQELRDRISSKDLDYVTAIASAVPGIIPDLIGGATVGGGAVFGVATAATAATGGVAAPVSAGTLGIVAAISGVSTAVVGFYNDFVSNIKSQQSALIETPIRTLSETKPTINDIINAQNANPGNAQDNFDAFRNQMALIDQARENLKERTDEDLNKFLGDTGINQIQEFDVFYQLNGERDRMLFDMQLALSNPDPSRIIDTSLTIEEIQKRIDNGK